MLKQRLRNIYEVAKSFDLALIKIKIKQNAKVLACGLSERTSLIYCPTFLIRNVSKQLKQTLWKI